MVVYTYNINIDSIASRTRTTAPLLLLIPNSVNETVKSAVPLTGPAFTQSTAMGAPPLAASSGPSRLTQTCCVFDP